MKIIRKAVLDKISPLIETQKKQKFLVINDEAEAFKWNFSSIRLDERPKCVLIGDSVSSGYFYRPGLTLAKLLQEAMPQYQVIDLTKTELYFFSLPGYSSLIKELNPEKVFICVGYNFDIEPQEDTKKLVYGNYRWIRDIATKDIKVIIPQLTSYLENLARHVWLRQAIREVCDELNLSYLDLNKVFHDDRYLIDYTHYTVDGLKVVAHELTGVKSKFQISHELEREFLLNAFFACYYRAYTDLCIKILKKIKVSSPEDFGELCATIRRAIFSSNGGLFYEDCLRQIYERKESRFVVEVTNTNHLYYPSMKFFKFLESETDRLFSWEKSKTINLLVLKRRGLAKFKVITNPQMMISPGGISWDEEFRARFHAQELLGDRGKLVIKIKSEDKMDFSLSLNQKEIVRDHMIKYWENELIIDLAQERYCEISIQGQGNFRVERLILTSDSLLK